jgi:transketolase
MTVISPSDAYCTTFAVKAVIERSGPVYLRLGRLAVPLVHDENTRFEFGKGVLIKDGSDVTIIANGLMVQYALEAARLLDKDGVNARVIDMHTIKPIDREIIIKAAKETGCIVTAEEHSIIGGLGGAVAEVVCSEYPVPVKMVGIEDKFGKSGKPSELLELYGLTSENIVKKAYEAMQML